MQDVGIDTSMREMELALAEGRGRASLPRRGMSSSATSEREFHQVADATLDEIHDSVEEALEDGFEDEFDCHMSVSSLFHKQERLWWPCIGAIARALPKL